MSVTQVMQADVWQSRVVEELLEPFRNEGWLRRSSIGSGEHPVERTRRREARSTASSSLSRAVSSQDGHGFTVERYGSSPSGLRSGDVALSPHQTDGPADCDGLGVRAEVCPFQPNSLPARDVQARNPHKVRLDLEGPEALEEAIALARKAYDEAGRAVARSASDPDAAWSPAPEYEELFERLRAGIADLGRDIEELPRVNYFVFSSGKRFAVVRQRKDHLFLNVALTHPFDDSEQLVSVEGTPTSSQRTSGFTRSG
jgi:Domain of unknown function (DUF5655)